jgi:hypothetical protein
VSPETVQFWVTKPLIVLLSLGVVLLLTVFPGIALWLPNTMIH